MTDDNAQNAPEVLITLPSGETFTRPMTFEEQMRAPKPPFPPGTVIGKCHLAERAREERAKYARFAGSIYAPTDVDG